MYCEAFSWAGRLVKVINASIQSAPSDGHKTATKHILRSSQCTYCFPSLTIHSSVYIYLTFSDWLSFHLCTPQLTKYKYGHLWWPKKEEKNYKCGSPLNYKSQPAFKNEYFFCCCTCLLIGVLNDEHCSARGNVCTLAQLTLRWIDHINMITWIINARLNRRQQQKISQKRPGSCI